MSKFIPRHIDVIYDSPGLNAVALDMSGETIEGTGVVTNTHILYPLAGGDQTNVNTIVAAIKTARGR
jgi:hypothetical protein